MRRSPSADSIHALAGFAKPVDVYCHQFVQDAQSKATQLSGTSLAGLRAAEGGRQAVQRVSGEETLPGSAEPMPSRPSQLDVTLPPTGPQLLSVEAAHSALPVKTPSSGSSAPDLEPGLRVSPSPSEGSGSRAVSPFAKIRSSMVQVASITQAGLSHGINLAVAKVQKSPAEPELLPETQRNELKSMFTQCQTRIIQI